MNALLENAFARNAQCVAFQKLLGGEDNISWGMGLIRREGDSLGTGIRETTEPKGAFQWEGRAQSLSGDR